MDTDAHRRLAEVVNHLGALREQAVFLGGSVLCVFIPDQQPRPTHDVDIVIHVDSVTDYEVLVARELRDQGWQEDDSEGAPVCRWRHPQAGVLDAMPTGVGVFGFANRWYRDACARARVLRVGDVELRVVTTPYFFATKIEAYDDRGGGDFGTSHDIEDLLAVLAGPEDPTPEVDAADAAVREFVITTFREWTRPASGFPLSFPITLGGGPSMMELHGRNHFTGDPEGDALDALARERMFRIAALAVTATQ